MWRKLKRFTFTTSLLCLATLPALADCPLRRSDGAVAPGLESLFDTMAATTIGSPNDDPNVNNAGMIEEGPEHFWLELLYLAEPSQGALPVVRFTQETASEVEMPEGVLATPIGNWTCLLAPGDQVYLSDGFTDHSTMVYRIDEGAREVTFIDPRADEVFLLSEKRVLEDFGGRWFTEGDRKLFAIPFSSVDTTLKLAQLTPLWSVLEVAAALAPELPPIVLQFWSQASYFAMVDPRRANSAAFDFVYALPEDSVDRALFANYLEAIITLSDRMYGGVTGPLDPGFEESSQYFPDFLSKNMNFRVVIDLIFAGLNDVAARQADWYMKTRGWDLDFAVMMAAACKELADEACRSHYATESRAEIDERLMTMFRCTTAPKCEEMLRTSGYGNTTTKLMQHRLDWLQ